MDQAIAAEHLQRAGAWKGKGVHFPLVQGFLVAVLLLHLAAPRVHGFPPSAIDQIEEQTDQKASVAFLTYLLGKGNEERRSLAGQALCELGPDAAPAVPDLIRALHDTNCTNLTGYRLPTEAEWEYACRAGAATSRYYGESDELLDKYAWYAQNAGGRSRPVGCLKPNDLGLFDMHGNVSTWCQEPYPRYGESQGARVIEEKAGSLIINDKHPRGLRGFSFTDQAADVRSADRGWNVPTLRLNVVGFRTVRTLR
jgi:hypothetical protein